MYDTLADRPADLPDLPPREPESFLDLLAGLEQRPAASDRGHAIARYQAWIERNSTASPDLHAAWFNLGVELSAAGDKAGAVGAYQNALALRPGFYPAAINLGTLLEAAGQPEAALSAWQQALQPDDARADLTAQRDRLAEAWRTEQQNASRVLHIGCGAYAREKLPPLFRNPGWREVRLDIDPAVRPDFVASMTDMPVIADASVAAVYSSHNLEHLYPHEVPLALHEIHRVLKPDGFTLIKLPDLQEVARSVAEGKLEDPLYISPMGPIAPIDILYGHRPSMAGGNIFMAHRTGFTGSTLAAALIAAGFAAVMVQRDVPAFALTAVAFRSHPDAARLAHAQAQMLQDGGQSAVLYTPAA
jgi:tetratricopeptide (TPR) repeat protein